MSDLLFPIISMVLLVLAEAGVLQFTGRQKVDWLDVIFNINSGHMMLWLFRCLEVLCYGLVVNHLMFVVQEVKMGEEAVKRQMLSKYQL